MITLSPPLIECCRAFAIALCDCYANGRSTELAYRGVERDVPLQTRAKMAECIFALELGFDPDDVINWDLTGPDNGADVTLDGRRYDVKACGPGASYLLWPRTKNHLFAEKQFDAMVLIRVHYPACGQISGWVTKTGFARLHQVADAGHRLDPGTWYMPQCDLAHVETLHREHRRPA